MIRKILSISVTLILLLVPASSVFAKDNGNGNGNSSNTTDTSGGVDTAPPDPGVSSGQDTTKTETIKWVLPHGDTFIIDGEEGDIVLDWESLNITDTRQAGSGSAIFIGIGGAVDLSDTDSTSCGDGNGRGNCNNNGNGNGGTGNGGGPLHSDTCGGVWVAPGKITATAQQIAPNSAVVIGQDPDENGVTVEYKVSLEPTVVSYEKWTLIGSRKVACAEDDKGNGNNSSKDPEDDCPKGWHQVVEHIWACTVKERVYKEGIDELIAGASLKLESRDWINGELAVAYPGATLQHPDWGFAAPPNCNWSGDLCNWTFTLKIPVVDPGWYDIKLEGLTEGTKASPARSFEIIAGKFGVYLMDNTALTQ
jgi:hypothetical protein